MLIFNVNDFSGVEWDTALQKVKSICCYENKNHRIFGY